MTDEAGSLFRREGVSTYVPTECSAGPWDRSILHGAAVAALFAGRMTPPDGTLARLTVELLAPVPMAPLELTSRETGGGRRVRRHAAALTAAGREVALASSIVVRRVDLDLPEKAREHTSPFDPATAPPLVEPNRSAETWVGWPSFDSLSLTMEWLRVEGDRRTHQWIGLAVAVVEGEAATGTEIAAVAADYAQSAVNKQLPFQTWSFRNADLTLNLSRAPVGSWVGLRSESLVQPGGAGFNAADIFDAEGRVGRSAAVLIVERRSPPP